MSQEDRRATAEQSKETQASTHLTESRASGEQGISLMPVGHHNTDPFVSQDNIPINVSPPPPPPAAVIQTVSSNTPTSQLSAENTPED